MRLARRGGRALATGVAGARFFSLPWACARSIPSLLDPRAALMAAPGPDSFAVHVESSKGPFDLRVHRDWSPLGADRVYYLMRAHYYDGVRFFRTVDNFVTQFGIHGDTAVSRTWRDRRIDDDPPRRSNVRGTVSFAKGNANTRTTQLFISYRDNSRLDTLGFSVVAQVVRGMTAVDSLYKGYGEAAPRGTGPNQGRIQTEGNKYLVAEFPKLDYIVTARVAEEWRRR